jgi:hypothetical protein
MGRYIVKYRDTNQSQKELENQLKEEKRLNQRCTNYYTCFLSQGFV